MDLKRVSERVIMVEITEELSTAKFVIQLNRLMDIIIIVIRIQ